MYVHGGKSIILVIYCFEYQSDLVQKVSFSVISSVLGTVKIVLIKFEIIAHLHNVKRTSKDTEMICLLAHFSYQVISFI